MKNVFISSLLVLGFVLLLYSEESRNDLVEVELHFSEFVEGGAFMKDKNGDNYFVDYDTLELSRKDFKRNGLVVGVNKYGEIQSVK